MYLNRFGMFGVVSVGPICFRLFYLVDVWLFSLMCWTAQVA